MEIAVINTLQSQFDKRQGKFSKTYLKTRQKALDYVIAHDFPGRKDEDYKYTPIDRILKKNFDFTKTVLTDRTDFDFKSSSTYYCIQSCQNNIQPPSFLLLGMDEAISLKPEFVHIQLQRVLFRAIFSSLVYT